MERYFTTNVTGDGLTLPIPGMLVQHEFISRDEEQELLNHVNRGQWNTSLRRRTQHFGYEYNYAGGSLMPARPIPDWTTPILQRIIDHPDVNLASLPNQLIVNEYRPGQGISAHVDSLLFGENVISLSLGHACIFRMTRRGPGVGLGTINIDLRPRTLVLMRGDARYRWRHQILPLSRWGGTRVSLTFRYVEE